MYYLTQVGVKLINKTDPQERQEKVDEILQLLPMALGGAARVGAGVVGGAVRGTGRAIGKTAKGTGNLVRKAPGAIKRVPGKIVRGVKNQAMEFGGELAQKKLDQQQGVERPV